MMGVLITVAIAFAALTFFCGWKLGKEEKEEHERFEEELDNLEELAREVLKQEQYKALSVASKRSDMLSGDVVEFVNAVIAGDKEAAEETYQRVLGWRI